MFAYQLVIGPSSKPSSLPKQQIQVYYSPPTIET